MSNFRVNNSFFEQNQTLMSSIWPRNCFYFLRKNKAKTLFFALIALIAATVTDATAAVWKYYPAVDDYPMRITGGNGITYFIVFQRMYSTNMQSYGEPHTAVFRHRDSRPEEGIMPLANEVRLNGSNIRMADYSPEGRFLTLVYDDGGIDFISDDGEVRHSDMLQRFESPGWRRLNSLTVCGTEVWIATESGYAAADGVTGSTIDMADIGKQVKWVARTGERIVAIADNALHSAPVSPFPRAFTAFSRIAAAGLPSNPKTLMPLSDISFAYLADPAPNAGTYSLNVAWLDGNEWKTRKLQDLWLPTAGPNTTVANIFERNVLPNRDGWLIYISGNFIQIYKDKDPAMGQLTETIAANLSQNVGGSPDFQSFWTYVSRGEFRHGHREGTNVIWDAGSIRPYAPASNVAARLSYSSKYGVVASNYGYSRMFMDLRPNQPVQISAFKDGKWREYSPLYIRPASSEGNESLAALYNSYRYTFPVADPFYLEFDPVYPDNVWMGSPFCGIAAVNMADPASDPVHIASSLNPLAGYPGFKAMIPDCGNWNQYDTMSTPSFDSDGTLWTAYYRFDATKDGKEPISLYYWTASDRKAALETRDPSQSPDMGCIAVDHSEKTMNSSIKVLALKHPRNRNLLVVYIPGANQIGRIDHNGTLSDTSDDSIDLFGYVKTNGGKWNTNYGNVLAEDPISGEVWYATSRQFYSFDPSVKPESGVMPGRVLDVEYGEQRGNPFDNISVTGVTFDDRGRMWVATDGAGIWCVSADRSRVEVHYTRSNSGILSDTAYGMVWNPESQSLMVATAEGLAEVHPDLPSTGVRDVNAPSVWPRNVRADYAGGVMIRGAKGNARICVSRPDGSFVKGFNADSSGAAVWDLSDSEGLPVATGLYRIESSSADFEPVEVTVMR